MGNIPLNTLDLNQLLELSESNNEQCRWGRSDVFKAAFKRYEDAGDNARIQAMKMEILAFDLTTKGSNTARFSPMFVGTDAGGEEVKYPNLGADFSDDTIDYYRSRMAETSNPVMQARYADIAWELRKDIDCARKAIDTYLRCAELYSSKAWDSELVDALERALMLAVSIKDAALISAAAQKHCEIIDQLADAQNHRWILEISKSLLTHRTKVSLDYGWLIKRLESAAMSYSEDGPAGLYLQRGFLEIISKVWAVEKKPQEQQDTQVRIAESFVRDAEWTRHNRAQGNAVAAHFYEQAMKAYADLGGHTDKVTELKRIIQECNTAAQEEYTEISADVSIPREHIEECASIYKGRAVDEFLRNLAVDPRLIPSYAEAAALADEHAKTFVLQHLFPTAVMRGNIRVKYIVKEEEKIEFSAIRNYLIDLHSLRTRLLDEIFTVLQKEHQEYVDELTKLLSSATFIDHKRMPLIEAGLRAFAAEDYVSAIHVLVFQVEGVLRDSLGLLRLPTFSYRNNEMRERMLSDVLGTLQTVKGSDTDFLKFVELVLCDLRGDNYRNNIAHGLVDAPEFTKQLAEWLIIMLLRLSSYKVVKGGDEDTSGPPPCQDATK